MIALATDLVVPISRVAEILSESDAVPAPGRELMSAVVPALELAAVLGPSLVQLVGDGWDSTAALGAAETVGGLDATVAGLADSAGEIGEIASVASEIVVRGKAEVVAIASEFLSRAAALGPSVITPPGQVSLLALATDHLTRAIQVVERVQSELEGPTARLATVTDSVPPAPREPSPEVMSVGVAVDQPDGAEMADAGVLTDVAAADGGADEGTAAADASAPAADGDSGVEGDSAPPADVDAAADADAGVEGDGVEVELPDGSTAVAPNEQAAGAVRSALTQQGVPYVWGGTTPGAGFDCSGLTQWAYRESGVEIPRLAQEQGIGSQVARDDLMPGDLAVWSGHVAMYIGEGQIIEAGNPVGVSGVRTENIGMDFYGFYRPTA